MRESGGCATFVRKDTVVIDGVWCAHRVPNFLQMRKRGCCVM